MFDYLAAGDGLGEFLAQFPTVDRATAVAVLELARRAIGLSTPNAEAGGAWQSSEDRQRVAGLWRGKVRLEPEFDQELDASFLGEVARPFLRQEAMQTSAAVPLAVAAGVRKKLLWVVLLDGRMLGVPVARFPRLARGTAKQRRNVVIEETGRGLHWPELDEDLGVEPLLTHVPVTPPAPKKSRRGNRPARLSKKWRKTQRRRSLRDAEEFALAEVAYPDPSRRTEFQRRRRGCETTG